MPADAFQPTWLCRTPRERARMIDMERRLAPVRHLCFAAMAVALVASGPWFGWWTLAPLALAAIGFVVLGRGIEDAARPEYRLALAWVLSQSLIAASIALTGGPDSPALAWLAIPTITLPARFGVRGVLAGSGLTIGILLLVTVGIDAAAVLDYPVPTIMTLTLIVSVTALSVALMRSDLEHRSEAAIDQLTGMLNRGALDARVAELEAQARRTPQPVALIVADLDRFKTINDEFGHAVGDAVLAEVAERFRGELRAYDLAYRLGGEEFLVLLPGAGEREAAELAESLRRCVAIDPIRDVGVTVSFGVGAWDGRGDFDFRELFDRVDRALYRAKQDGRDRVVRAGNDAPPAAELRAA
jgi:diguanylate cyclase (GGDEF)-like protein